MMSSSDEIDNDEQKRNMNFKTFKPHFKSIPYDKGSEANILTSQNDETRLDEKLSKLHYRKEFKEYLLTNKKQKQSKQISQTLSPIKPPKISLLEAIDPNPSEFLELEQQSSQFSIHPERESSYLSVNFQERRKSSSSYLSVNFRKQKDKDKDKEVSVKLPHDLRQFRNIIRPSQQKLTFQERTKKGDSIYLERRKSRLSSNQTPKDKDIKIESSCYKLRRKKQLNVTSIVPTQPPQPSFQQGSLLQTIQSAQRVYSYQYPEELLQLACQRKNSNNSGTSTPRGILKKSQGSSESNKRSAGSNFSLQSMNSPINKATRDKRVKFSFTKKQAHQMNIPC